MDGNYKSVYPNKNKWPNENMQKNAEKFQKGFRNEKDPEEEDKKSKKGWFQQLADYVSGKEKK